MDVTCPGCGAGYQVPDTAAGKQVRCKNERCQQLFTVTAAPVPPPHPTPSAAGPQVPSGTPVAREGPAAPPVAPPMASPSPASAPPLPPTAGAPADATDADVILTEQDATRTPAGKSLVQKIKEGFATLKKRAQALKLKYDVKNLEKAIDHQLENLGRLAVQHRPAEVDVAAEIAALSEVRRERTEKEAALESLHKSPGSRAVVKGLKCEITEFEDRERAIMVQIGRKTNLIRPDLPGAAAAYGAIDMLRSYLEAKTGRLAEVESQIRPITEGAMPKVGAFKMPLMVAAGAVGGIVVLWLLWGLLVSPMSKGSLLAWARYCIPNDAQAIAYVNLQKLRDADSPEEPGGANPWPFPQTYGLDEDDITEFFAVGLKNGSVMIFRTEEHFSLEDLMPGPSGSSRISEYRDRQYLCPSRLPQQWLAKTDAYTYCCADNEKILKDVLARLDRQTDPELHEDFQEVLDYALGGDLYSALVGSAYPGMLVEETFSGILVGYRLPPIVRRAYMFYALGGLPSGGSAVSLRMSVSSSLLEFEGAFLFHLEREAKRYEEGYEKSIDKRIEEFKDAAKHMSKKEREIAEKVLDALEGMSVSQRGKMVRMKGSWDLEGIEELMDEGRHRGPVRRPPLPLP